MCYVITWEYTLMDKSHQTPNDDRCEINCINLFCVTFGAEHTVQVINDDCVAVVMAPFKQNQLILM